MDARQVLHRIGQVVHRTLLKLFAGNDRYAGRRTEFAVRGLRGGDDLLFQGNRLGREGGKRHKAGQNGQG